MDKTASLNMKSTTLEYLQFDYFSEFSDEVNEKLDQTVK